MSMRRVFSGIQPTADSFHLGNYLGAVRHYTRSLPLAILLHSLNNAVGMAVIADLAQR